MLTKLCVFDLDGTLLDTIGDLCAAGNHALAAFDMPERSLDQYRKMVGNGMARLVERMTGWSRASEQYNAVFRQFLNYYRTHSMDHTKAYDGISSVLFELQQKGVCLAVLSNKSDEFVGKLVHHYFPEIDFDILQGQSDRFPVKPDPTALKDIMRRLSIREQDTIYIGDSDVDVYTAHNAGVMCIGAVWGFRGADELRKAGADSLAFRPADILNSI